MQHPDFLFVDFGRRGHVVPAGPAAFLPILLLLTVPIASIIILFWSIYPRTVRSSGSHFHVKKKVDADDFADPPEDEETFIRQLRDRCVMLANILSRKMWLFKISIGLCLVYHIVLLALLAIGGVMEFRK